jgi:hypothetical protein
MNPRPIRSMKKIAVFRHAGFVLGVTKTTRMRIQ